jgi:amino acid adenylation domain-containing protein
MENLKNLSSEQKRALLAELLDQRSKTAEVYPLSFSQERLWFLDQLQPGNPAYNIPAAYQLPGRIDLDLLERAFKEILRRHEILRTVFGIADGRPVQIVRSEAAFSMERLDLRRLPEAERRKRAAELFAEEAHASFDLSNGPLLRAKAVRLGEEEHLLILVLHHIVADAWSMRIFFDELLHLYDAFGRGGRSRLPDLNIQYKDFSVWQRERMSGDALNRLLSYWRDSLKGAPPVLALPTDRPYPRTQRFEGDQVVFFVPRGAAEKLQAISRGERVTLFMALLAAFTVLLQRYTGQDDIVVGTPIANRNRSEIEPLIGFFVNTLALRSDLSGNPSFRELLRRVRACTLGAYEHQDLPFEKLVQELRQERHLNRNPVFQVMFAFENTPQSSVFAPGGDTGPNPDEVGPPPFAKFDLTVNVRESPSGLAGNFEYRTDLFEAETVRRMTRHFVRLLSVAAENPDSPVGDLQMLDEAERRQLIYGWNATERPYPADASVVSLFEAQAKRTPEATAVESESERLSYAELNARANRLAHSLRERGVTADVLVGVRLKRSANLVAALLGILKAGGAYVPLSATDPPKRTAAIVKDARCALVLAERAAAEGISDDPEIVVLLDGADREAIDRASSENPGIEARPDDLAYVLYTSGSTGAPKGVGVPHGALANHMFWMNERWPLGAGDAVLQKTPCTFDASVWEFYAPLMQGARLVAAREDGHMDPVCLIEAIQRFGITVLQLVPSLLRLMLETPGFEGCTTLRHLFCGGEALSPDLRDRFFQRLPAELHNLYGPTETTIDATAWSCERLDTRPLVPIGKPIANVRAYVLDPCGEPVPIGVAGELFIGGRGVARGYIGRPELTAERFLDDPFSGEPGTRMYRTGDRVRRLPDGSLEFLGRADDQVKIRGIRFEPGEIEGALREHPQIADAAVIVRKSESGDPRLTAFLLLHDDQPPEELRAFAADRLPPALIPSDFVALSSFPRTRSGKVDRQALAAAVGARIGPITPHVAPRNAVEAVVGAFFAEALECERVSASENLFELGAHSLMIAQAAGRIRSLLGTDLPLQRFFEGPSVMKVAAALIERNGRVEEACRVLLTVSRMSDGEVARAREEEGPLPPFDEASLAHPPKILLSPARRDLLQSILRRCGSDVGFEAEIPRRAPGAPLPLSFAQERFWILEQLEGPTALYNVPGMFRLPSDVRLDALRRSIEMVVKRHESLRTTFPTVDGLPVQKISDQISVPLREIDLGALPDAELERETRRLTVEEARRPFDLENGPLLRTAVLRRRPGDALLLFTIHHIISDAWSTDLFFRELTAAYDALCRGLRPNLPLLRLQYADFAIWQRAQMKGDLLRSQLSYWKKQLADAPTYLPLPTDRPRSQHPTLNGSVEAFSLPADLAEALRKRASDQGATLFMLVLAGFAALLRRYSHQEELLIGTPISNRSRPEFETLIGLFLNTLVLRVDLREDPSFHLLIERVRRMTLDAFDHQDLPFERLVEELQPERNMGISPLFQVLFTLQTAASPEAGAGSSPNDAGLVTTGTAKFDLTLSMIDTGGVIQGAWEYNTDLFDRSTMQRMSAHFETLLRAAAARPDEKLSAQPLLPETERDLLIETWNTTAAAYPQQACIHHLFEAQVLRTPEAVALRHREAALTFAELNRLANRLAHLLIERGVEPKGRVAVLMDRSIEVVVAMLGIAKAGATYVPVNPRYPAERLAFILKDVGARLTLTQKCFAGLLPIKADRVIVLDRDFDTLHRFPDGDPEIEIDGDDPLYVIYTSGSTGLPKGVLLSHRVLVNLVWWQLDRSRGIAGGATAQLSSLFFDVSLQEIFSTWCAGETLVMPTEEARNNMEQLLPLLRDRAVRRIFLPYVGLRQLADAVQATGIVPGSLLQIITAGEPLHLTPNVETLMRRLPECRLYNQYGPSETHIVSEYTLSGPPESWPRFPPVGKPVPNTQFYVLDPDLRPVPIGVHGELYIGGDCLAEGYLNRPDLTEERFIPNPFHPRLSARIYKSGDLARFLPDGNVELLGRIDRQVKVRGFRVELGEIEAILAQHPGVRETVVLALPDGSGSKRLVGFLVPKEGHDPSQGELIRYLALKLPEYMVPIGFVTLDRIPLTPSGKVDAIRLGQYEISRPKMETEFVAPNNARERRLAEIWGKVLNIDRVGTLDNFFELGGHSLLATQVMSRIREEFQVEVPLRRLFETPTIKGLSTAIGEYPEKVEPNQEIDQLLDALDDLPADELEQLLSEKEAL